MNGHLVAQRIVETQGTIDAAVGAPVTVTGGILTEGGPTFRSQHAAWYTASSTGQQMTIDLGGQVNVIYVVSFSTYYTDDARYIPAVYSIDYSTNDATGTNVVTVTGDTRTDVYHQFANQVTARYIRLTINAFQPGQTYAMITGFSRTN